MRRMTIAALCVAWACDGGHRPDLVLDASLADDGGAELDAGPVDGGTDAGICFPETEGETCTRLALCGVVDAPDNCGVVVRLDCPSCDADAGPVDVDGGCLPEGGGHTCVRLDLCGTVTATDNCGSTATIFCRSCGDGGMEDIDAGPLDGGWSDGGRDGGRDGGPIDGGPPDAGKYFGCFGDTDCRGLGSATHTARCDGLAKVCVVITSVLPDNNGICTVSSSCPVVPPDNWTGPAVDDPMCIGSGATASCHSMSGELTTCPCYQGEYGTPDRCQPGYKCNQLDAGNMSWGSPSSICRMALCLYPLLKPDAGQ